MFSERKLINYAHNFLTNELYQIDKMLAKDGIGYESKNILLNLKYEYTQDIKELENEYFI